MRAKSGLTRFSNCLILRNNNIIKEDLWIRDGKIINPEQVFYVEQEEAEVTVNCQDSLIVPGFIDIQINGGWSVDFSYDSEKVEEGVNKVAKQLLAHGVTSFCPTMVTSEKDKYYKILPKICKAQGGKHGATVLGVHLEGPFISAAKKGAHKEDYILNPEKGLESIKEQYGSLENVVLVTLAPELPGALDAIKGLSDMGIKVALGHSSASLAQGEEGIKCGANLITHLFNAMLPFHHRDPGLVGLLTSETERQVYYGIISDGIHTHPAALRIACRTNKEAKGAQVNKVAAFEAADVAFKWFERQGKSDLIQLLQQKRFRDLVAMKRCLVLVSDAVAAQGLADGNYRIGPQAVNVNDGRAYIAGTKTLCGSTTALDESIKTFKEATDCSLEYALEAASLHPAKALGIDDRKGKLNFNCDADFVILHPKSLKVLSTWIAGECVYESI